MAKQPGRRPNPQPAGGGGPTPYPKNWGTMAREQRNEWMRKNRPARDPGERIPPPAVEQQQPARQQPARQQPEQQQPEQQQQPEYAQEGRGASFTFTYADIEQINPMELAADVLRAVADHLCAPAGEQDDDAEF